MKHRRNPRKQSLEELCNSFASAIHNQTSGSPYENVKDHYITIAIAVLELLQSPSYQMLRAAAKIMAEDENVYSDDKNLLWKRCIQKIMTEDESILMWNE